MKRGRLLILVIAFFLLGFYGAACGGRGGRQGPVPFIPTGQAVQPDVETPILLASGAGAIFPVGSFSSVTTVQVHETLTGEQRDAAGYPEDAGDLLGATVVSIPTSSTLLKDITVRIALKTPQAPGTGFVVFRFNTSTHMWETTEATTSSLKGVSAIAVVGSSGNIVSFTAPTANTTGFSAAYAVFENYTAEAPPPGPGPGENRIPTVELVADATAVDPGVTVNLTATGADADGDALTFTWLAPGGTLGTPNTSGNTSTVTWSSTNPGMFTISVSVNDGRGGVGTDAVAVTVITPGVENNPPSFGDTSIKSDVSAPVATQKVIFSATATDPDGDPLTYTWDDGTGGSNFFDPSVDEETGTAKTWWSIATAGDYTVTVTANDGKGGTASLTYDVTVGELPTSFEWEGYEYCIACHNTKVEGWLTTNHSDALERSINPSPYGFRNEACYDCHAVGQFPVGDGGFIDQELTPQFANIQCESCHGTAFGHPASGPLPSPWDPGTGYKKDADGNYVYSDSGYHYEVSTEGEWFREEHNLAKVPGGYTYDEAYDGSNGYGCGLCHEGARHGAFEEWRASAHGSFAFYEEDGVTPEHNVTGASCVKCHNGKYYVEIQIEGEDPPAEDLTEVNEDSAHISCAVCHDPHSNQFEHQLRVDPDADVIIPFDDTPVSADSANICITCHNGRRTRADMDNFIAGGTFRGMHPNNQGTTLFGIGGFEFPGFEYDKEHPHNTWNEEKCIACHMWTRDYIDADNPGIWGHSFEPRAEACLTCHVGDPATFKDEFVEPFHEEVEALMAEFVEKYPYKDMTDPANPVLLIRPEDGGPPADDIGNQYRQAAWNYLYVEEDGTHGIHNPDYALDLLESAIAKLDELNAMGG